jgi:hypothetical protein
MFWKNAANGRWNAHDKFFGATVLAGLESKARNSCGDWAQLQANQVRERRLCTS